MMRIQVLGNWVVVVLMVVGAGATIGCGGSSDKGQSSDAAVNNDAPVSSTGGSGDAAMGGSTGSGGALSSGGAPGSGSGGNSTASGGAGGTSANGGASAVGGNSGVGGGAVSSACLATAQAECDLQKRCDPVKFALEWDGEDTSKFCVPHTAAACQANVPTRLHGGIGAACETWLKADCANYLSYYYPTMDSNGKRVNFDPSCQTTAVHGTRTMDQPCTADLQCATGLYCKFAGDEPMANANADRTCGVCRPALAYPQSQLATRAGLFSGDLVAGAYCNRDSQCLTGYGCVLPFDVSDGSPQVLESADTDRHCMLLMKRGANALCVKGSNFECDATVNLICPAGAPTADPATSPKCMAAPAATVKVYLEAGVACTTTDECNPQKHLTCIADAGGTKRCTLQKVAAIGAPCSAAISCSQYARCNNNQICEERRKNGEACDDTAAVAASYCYPAAFANEPFNVCRTAAGQIMPRCQPPEAGAACQ